MGIAQRIEDTVEHWVDIWSSPLRGWMASWFTWGLELFFTSLEPGMVDSMKEILQGFIDTPETPPKIKRLMQGTVEEGNILKVMAGFLLTIASIIPAMLGAGEPLGRIFSYAIDRQNTSYRFDPMSVMTLWRRDQEKYQALFDHLLDQGIHRDLIDALKKLTEAYPPVPDMVRFADFGSFDPEVIAAWRQFYDAPGWISEPMKLIGIENEPPTDWANKYWFSHWVQPGRYELGDMYRRGLMGKPLIGGEEIGEPGGPGEAEETIKLAYRTMGYSSFWQDRLLQLVREIPTRVDVRRWWDMRTIDETELRSIYQRRGYFGKDLANYVLWTKVYVAFPDLITRWKNGWITLDDVRTELTGLGMPAERVEEFIQTKIKAEEPGRVEEGRALTKTEIYKGVKKGYLTWEQGLELLMDLNYTYAEADYLLDINVGALEGSPETFEEFKRITEKYRTAISPGEEPMPSYIRAKAAEVVNITGEVKALEAAVAEEEKSLIDVETLSEEATAHRDELRVALHRAEAELARIKQEYDALVAEWKHRETEGSTS